MELKKNRQNWPFYLILIWFLLLLLFGVWWPYLIFKLGNQLQALNVPGPDFLKMALWEGSVFFVLLFSVTSAFFSLYLRDRKRHQALNAFFASITHELKTPLASMRLQTEVIKDLIESDQHLPVMNKLSQLTTRLLEDNFKLESEMDKILQLARMEKGGELSLESIDLLALLKRYKVHFNYEIKCSNEDPIYIRGDQQAWQIILRNLTENTKKHRKINQSRHPLFTLTVMNANQVEVRYEDFGEKFSGNLNQLGKLFYRFNSPQGSGIGIYLITLLTKKMEGQFSIEETPHLVFKFIFSVEQRQEL